MTASPPLIQTTIGKKVAMAGSGVVLLLWLIAHMLGNLKLWLSDSEYDTYAHWLRRVLQPPFPHTWFLWLIRGVTVAALVIHVYYAVVLARRSRRARVTRYHKTAHVQADAAALTMRWGGLTIFVFVIFHLSMFTWGWLHPGYTFVKTNPAGNVIGAFNQWWMVVIYAVALFALAMHIYHASWSIFQTLGINNRRWDLAIRRTATGLSAFIFLGFLSIPVGVLSGGLK
jgi:succinate dehydrogenase / fumarate reductase cytochrome b subunit